MKKMPVHLDFDTGTDDAIALILALLSQDKIEIKSISTVAGNAPLEVTSRNTLNIVDVLEEHIKVSKGADKPLKRELECALSHGETGIGSVILPESKQPFYEKEAWDTIYETACESSGELIYMGVGPQTNLALALQKYPDLKEKIKRVYLMGGALAGGNMTQASEFNAYVDPEALKIVFAAGIPVTMIGLDVTLQAVLPDWVKEEISKMNSKHARIVNQIMDHCIKVNLEHGWDSTCIHDALAFCAIVKPEVIKTKSYYVDVETEGTLTRGMTVADFCDVYPDREKNIDCAVEVDVDMFWNWMIDLLKTA